MSIGILTLYLRLPGCASLKEKRGRLKPFIARLQRDFNLSVAEVDQNDEWHEAVVACALVSNQNAFTNSALQKVANFAAGTPFDVELNDYTIEILA